MHNVYSAGEFYEAPLFWTVPNTIFFKNLQKFLGFAPSRAMNKQGQFGGGFFSPPQR